MAASVQCAKHIPDARGPDVNPGTIERFRRAGGTETVQVLEIVHADKMTHVTSGHRWFTWLCDQQGVEPIATFREEVKRGWRGEIKGSSNVEARQTVGLTKPFYENLWGNMDSVKHDKEEGVVDHSSVQTEYNRS